MSLQWKMIASVQFIRKMQAAMSTISSSDNKCTHDWSVLIDFKRVLITFTRALSTNAHQRSEQTLSSISATFHA